VTVGVLVAVAVGVGTTVVVGVDVGVGEGIGVLVAIAVGVVVGVPSTDVETGHREVTAPNSRANKRADITVTEMGSPFVCR